MVFLVFVLVLAFLDDIRGAQSITVIITGYEEQEERQGIRVKGLQNTPKFESGRFFWNIPVRRPCILLRGHYSKPACYR